VAISCIMWIVLDVQGGTVHVLLSRFHDLRGFRFDSDKETLGLCHSSVLLAHRGP